jgi:hypothetical protein
MKTNGIIIPFFANERMREREYYRVLFEFQKVFLKEAEKKIDKILIIDSGWNFTEKDIVWLKDVFGNKLQYEKAPEQDHWDNMNIYLKEIHTDYILIMDQDTIIYDLKVLDEGFGLENTVKGILDSSGGFQLPFSTILDANKERGKRFRFAPYLTFIDSSLLKKIDIDFSPKQFNQDFKIRNLDYQTKVGDWTDSMGYMTLQLLGIEGAKFVEMKDDRRSLYLREDGIIEEEEFLEGEPLKENLGYYHIRNFTKVFELTSGYAGAATPKELMRMLAWVNMMSITTKYKVPTEFEQSLFLVTPYWKEYYNRFLNYHDWIIPYTYEKNI